MNEDLRGVSGSAPVVESLQAGLESNRAERSRLKMVGLLFALTIPFLAVSVMQLGEAGKASARELVSMSIFFGGTLLVSAAAMAFRYSRLARQHHGMQTALADLTGEVECSGGEAL